jgi:hypothetical protein
MRTLAALAALALSACGNQNTILEPEDVDARAVVCTTWQCRTGWTDTIPVVIKNPMAPDTTSNGS